jgi:hypothetical protein
VTVLRLHRDLYLGEAVDQAIGVYAPHGDLSRREDPSHWVVEITARSPERERRIAGELANYALGLTTQGRRRANGGPRP